MYNTYITFANIVQKKRYPKRSNSRNVLYCVEQGVEKPCVRDPRSPSAVDPRKQV